MTYPEIFLKSLSSAEFPAPFPFFADSRLFEGNKPKDKQKYSPVFPKFGQNRGILFSQVPKRTVDLEKRLL